MLLFICFRVSLLFLVNLFLSKYVPKGFPGGIIWIMKFPWFWLSRLTQVTFDRAKWGFKLRRYGETNLARTQIKDSSKTLKGMFFGGNKNSKKHGTFGCPGSSPKSNRVLLFFKLPAEFPKSSCFLTKGVSSDVSSRVLEPGIFCTPPGTKEHNGYKACENILGCAVLQR